MCVVKGCQQFSWPWSNKSCDCVKVSFIIKYFVEFIRVPGFVNQKEDPDWIVDVIHTVALCLLHNPIYEVKIEWLEFSVGRPYRSYCDTVDIHYGISCYFFESQVAPPNNFMNINGYKANALFMSDVMHEPSLWESKHTLSRAEKDQN